MHLIVAAAKPIAKMLWRRWTSSKVEAPLLQMVFEILQ